MSTCISVVFISFSFMCACSCVWRCMHVPMFTEVRGQPQVHTQECCLLCVLDRLSLVWNSPSVLGWLLSKPQGFPCLCLPSAGIVGTLRLTFPPLSVIYFVCSHACNGAHMEVKGLLGVSSLLPGAAGDGSFLAGAFIC